MPWHRLPGPLADPQDESAYDPAGTEGTNNDRQRPNAAVRDPEHAPRALVAASVFVFRRPGGAPGSTDPHAGPKGAGD